jgi:GT2 family glycosyltransferase
MVTGGFCDSLWALGQYDRDHGHNIGQLRSAVGPLIINNRNSLMVTFLQLDRRAQWLLMLDTDIVFPPTLLVQLLAAAENADEEVDVLAAHYNVDRLEGRMSSWTLPRKGKEAGAQLVDIDDPSLDALMPPRTELWELASCGMGATLISRRVAEEIGRRYIDDGHRWFAEEDFSAELGLPFLSGEDVGFCVRARRWDFKIWGAPFIRVGHLKLKEI